MAQTLSQARLESSQLHVARRQAARDEHLARLRLRSDELEEAQAELRESVPHGAMRTVEVGMGRITRYGV